MIFSDDLLFTLIKAVFITTCTLGMMSSLTRFKYHTNKVLAFFSVYLVWVTGSTAAILFLFGFEGIMRVFLLTISAPAIFLAYKMDQDSPAQSVFNYATQIAFSLVLTMASALLNLAVHGNQYTDLLIRAVSYTLVIYAEHRFLYKPFCRLTDVVKTGWGLLSLIPIAFSLLLVLVGTVPGHYIYNPVNALYILGITITILVVYFAVYQSLMYQWLQILTRDRDVLQVQISAMNKRPDAVLAAEEKLRILRHDVRHIAGIMQSNLQSGFVGKAADVLSTFEATVADTAIKCYCEDYGINSILVSYLEKAEKEGIAVQVSFAAPPAEKMEATAFSVMLANALENALEACGQETEHSTIELKSRIFNGQYLMELSNTCNKTIFFDQDGLPVSQKGEGHGIGTRSIFAFGKAHEATIHFRRKGERFVLQIMFSVE